MLEISLNLFLQVPSAAETEIPAYCLKPSKAHDSLAT